MTVTVLIVDDHPVVREGMRGMLAGEPDIEVVGEAGDGAEAAELASSLHPDVVLMDLRMPGTCLLYTSVGVGVHTEQAKLIGHPYKIWLGELSRRARVGRLYDGPMPEGVYFRQLLAGRDFAAGDQFATTMRNHVYVVGDSASGEVVLVDPAYDVPALLGWVEEAGLTLAGVLATHYHADHVGGDIFGEHIQGLVDLLELAEVPVHVQKDEMAWVSEMSGAPVLSLIHI